VGLPAKAIGIMRKCGSPVCVVGGVMPATRVGDRPVNSWRAGGRCGGRGPYRPLGGERHFKVHLASCLQ